MRLSDFDLQALRVFVAVAEHRGFNRAQLALGLSQPAISQKVKGLEERLGFALCRRGRSGFALTEKGAIVLDKAKRLLANAEDFGNEVSELKTKLSGVLRVGIADSTITNPAFEPQAVLKRFCAAAPDVYVKLNVGTTDDLARDLSAGALQVVIAPLTERVSGFRYVDLFAEKHLLYCGADHPFFARRGPDAEALRGAKVVTRAYLDDADLVTPKGTNAAATVSSMEAQAMLILSGHYVGYLPEHYAAAWVKQRKLRAIAPARYVSHSRFVLAARKSPQLPHLVRSFIDATLSYAGTYAAGR